jgi:hypothetical protein
MLNADMAKAGSKEDAPESADSARIIVSSTGPEEKPSYSSRLALAVACTLYPVST